MFLSVIDGSGGNIKKKKKKKTNLSKKIAKAKYAKDRWKLIKSQRGSKMILTEE